jgi:hypothetical protein
MCKKDPPIQLQELGAYLNIQETALLSLDFQSNPLPRPRQPFQIPVLHNPNGLPRGVR